MGVDVWVRRPGSPLAGVGAWDAQALARPGVAAVEPAPSDVGQAVLAAVDAPGEQVGGGVHTPTVARAPFEPATGDVAARWDALRSEVQNKYRKKSYKDLIKKKKKLPSKAKRRKR